MTILFAYINKKQAAVASDGNVVSNNIIVACNQDKTFCLYDNKIVGAFSYNMNIDHNIYGNTISIGEVIKRIAGNIKRPDYFGSLVDSLIRPYSGILNSPDTTAPPMAERSSNILLAGSKNFDGANFEIYRLRFGADQNEVNFIKKEGPFSGVGEWYVDPPDEEFEQILNAVNAYFSNLPHGLTPLELAKKGVEIGISTSKIMKVNGKFLGGKISTRKTSY